MTTPIPIPTKTIQDATVERLVGNVSLEDLRGGQRLCYLLLVLLSGRKVNTLLMSDEMAISRQNVYRLLRELGTMGVPVVNFPFGEWTLIDFISEEDLPLDLPPMKPRKKRLETK